MGSTCSTNELHPCERWYAGGFPRCANNTLNAFNTYLPVDLLGGRKVMKIARTINAYKALTPFVVLALVHAYNNSSAAAWPYLGLHRTDGVCWLVKHMDVRVRRGESSHDGWRRRVHVAVASDIRDGGFPTDIRCVAQRPASGAWVAVGAPHRKGKWPAIR